MLKKGNNKGLTLIEVLASMVLLSLLAVLFTAVFPPAAGWIVHARKETLAASYGCAIIEELRSNRQQIESSNTGKTAQFLFPNAGFPWDGLTDEIVRMQSWGTYNNLYEITVKVSWYEGADQRWMELNTIMRKE